MKQQEPRMNFVAKKSLGQNFLHAPHITGTMIHAADIQARDIILEAGPGKGALTSELLQTGAHVIAVEKDDRAVEFLREKFASEIKKGTLTLLHEDILDFDPKKSLPKGEYTMAANIPYYITGEFLRKFLESDRQPKKMILIVQKEVAKRIVDTEKESILSISVKAYGEPRYIETVPARHFRPVPKVDSAVILIDALSKAFFTKNSLNEEFFFKILKMGFAHKRKVLINNLKKAVSGDILQKIWNKMELSPTIRAEKLSLKNWGEITAFIAHSDLL
jgi:16S rRNA (adenine1518-N6/adenine1519-N6)-dimethyltransferase